MSGNRKILALETAYQQVSNVLNRKDLIEEERKSISAAANIIARTAHEASCMEWGRTRGAQIFDEAVLEALCGDKKKAS